MIELAAEFLFLKPRVRSHARELVSASQLKHAQVQGMEASQRDELKFVSHGCELGLKAGDGGVVELLLPVERRRTVVGQHLARKFRMDGVGKLARFFKIRMRSLAPDELHIRSIGKSAGDGGFNAAANAVE